VARPNRVRQVPISNWAFGVGRRRSHERVHRATFQLSGGMSGLVKGSMADICRRLEARSFGLVKGLLAEVSCLEAFEPRFLLRSRERRLQGARARRDRDPAETIAARDTSSAFGALTLRSGAPRASPLGHIGSVRGRCAFAKSILPFRRPPHIAAGDGGRSHSD